VSKKTVSSEQTRSPLPARTTGPAKKLSVSVWTQPQDAEGKGEDAAVSDALLLMAYDEICNPSPSLGQRYGTPLLTPALALTGIGSRQASNRDTGTQPCGPICRARSEIEANAPAIAILHARKLKRQHSAKTPPAKKRALNIKLTRRGNKALQSRPLKHRDPTLRADAQHVCSPSERLAIGKTRLCKPVRSQAIEQPSRVERADYKLANDQWLRSVLSDPVLAWSGCVMRPTSARNRCQTRLGHAVRRKVEGDSGTPQDKKQRFAGSSHNPLVHAGVGPGPANAWNKYGTHVTHARLRKLGGVVRSQPQHVKYLVRQRTHGHLQARRWLGRIWGVTAQARRGHCHICRITCRARRWTYKTLTEQHLQVRRAQQRGPLAKTGVATANRTEILTNLFSFLLHILLLRHESLYLDGQRII
jgi:hypothetical protein